MIISSLTPKKTIKKKPLDSPGRAPAADLPLTLSSCLPPRSLRGRYVGVKGSSRWVWTSSRQLWSHMPYSPCNEKILRCSSLTGGVVGSSRGLPHFSWRFIMNSSSHGTPLTLPHPLAALTSRRALTRRATTNFPPQRSCQCASVQWALYCRPEIIASHAPLPAKVVQFSCISSQRTFVDPAACQTCADTCSTSTPARVWDQTATPCSCLPVTCTVPGTDSNAFVVSAVSALPKVCAPKQFAAIIVNQVIINKHPSKRSTSPLHHHVLVLQKDGVFMKWAFRMLTFSESFIEAMHWKLYAFPW